MEFVEQIYSFTKSWPKDEQYGLTSQLRRTAVSIPSNIAEGQGRSSTKEFIHHLSIARGSLLEAETQIIIGQRLGYLEEPSAAKLLAQAGEVSPLISGLARSLQNNQ
ncbi:MAG: four helix bundle protein [Chloroflexia bacterium]